MTTVIRPSPSRGGNDDAIGGLGTWTRLPELPLAQINKGVKRDGTRRLALALGVPIPVIILLWLFFGH
ncbi:MULTISPECIES: hypothetical protein [Bradyrhizobium]|jgi:hypothetical protein|uniref:hypothetical protein n=1 Tax=Bradyrhizobium TaxID=374 RepID=UPI0009B845B7|nr:MULTISPECIES: hypothetical protein [Bradyrhizobium]MCS3446124.1 hypothetical protein [Bradyrhizobium elkanii]MCS3562743.1 hypothetical protein [Bradyrhizobium elkanii]MCW2147420.1 hypothetical protein [Bradyrhizobium elkanii]MCW2353497.1 hypothetical protein [Bradyrhizobium elkanii]MCW2371147.1 hypothetical protein [Bradyrhizobium elkanii]